MTTDDKSRIADHVTLQLNGSDDAVRFSSFLVQFARLNEGGCILSVAKSHDDARFALRLTPIEAKAVGEILLACALSQR